MSTIQAETRQALAKLEQSSYNTVAYADMQCGRMRNEPLYRSLDDAIHYAKAYRKRFEQPVKNDYVLGPEYLKWITGLRGLLNGDGAIAMELNRGTDSKDNGTLEAMFWSAMELAGFAEEDL